MEKNIFVIDNSGVTDGPFASTDEAKEEIRKNVVDYKFQYKGNCRIVEVLEQCDNWLQELYHIPDRIPKH